MRALGATVEVHGKDFDEARLWVEEQARTRGYHRLSLETGSTEPFAAALRLYESEGFVPCGPFGDYIDTPFTRFFTREL